MKIAITGGTGFVGRHLAHGLSESGHEVVLIARGADRRDANARNLPGASFFSSDLSDAGELGKAFAGCEAIAHCAGINRETGPQTYGRVHVSGTQNVVEAARRAGVRKVVLLSFLRARPACGSAYHESKWRAEEMIRGSGLDYTVLKCGVIYGLGDHMLDHLSHALCTFPVFGLVGFKSRNIRPLAVEDLVRVLRAALLEHRLSRQTIAILGPEEVPLQEAVRRVGCAIGVQRPMMRLPVIFHYGLAWLLERMMKIPMVSIAQVRILSEGITEPLPRCEFLPADLAPQTGFSDEQIRRGLPPRGRFTGKDCFWSQTA